MKILTVLNSQRAIGCAAPGAGVQLKEVAVPCNFLSDAGAALTLATQFSGRLRLPAGHTDNASQTLAVRRFKQDGSARVALAGMRHSMCSPRATATPCSMPLAMRPAGSGAPGTEA